jgi:hypothetical protein
MATTKALRATERRTGPGAARTAAAAAAPAGGGAARSPRILSSAHLAEGPAGELSEFEFGLIVAHNAFSRWAMRCMAAAGMADLTITDVLVLHHVRHRDRAKRLSDICFTLNYEDTHVVSYALRKLVGPRTAVLGEAGQGGAVLDHPPRAARWSTAIARSATSACCRR